MTHYFRTSTHWVGRTDGMVSSECVGELPIAAPPAFGGHEGSWTPEAMLVAAAEACTMLTFLALAKARHISVRRYESTAEGTLENDSSGTLRFTAITIKPRIELADASLGDAARRLTGQLPKLCFIGASLKNEPKIEAELCWPVSPSAPSTPNQQEAQP